MNMSPNDNSFLEKIFYWKRGELQLAVKLDFAAYDEAPLAIIHGLSDGND